jgi:hypothetical protein
MAVQALDTARRARPDSYAVHSLEALDGVFIQVLLNGETAGYAFGATAEIATETAAREIVPWAAARSSQA